MVRVFIGFFLVVCLCLGNLSLAAETLYEAAVPGMAVYEIGRIQIDLTKRHDPQVVVPWRLVRPGQGSPSVHAITGKQKLTLIFTGVGRSPSGTLRFDYEGSTQKPAAVAIWFQKSRMRNTTCLLSNVATLGDVDPKQLPVIAGAKQAADFVEKKIKGAPPADTPQGFVRLTRSHPHVPGMPIKAGRDGKWLDAEVLAIDNRGWVTIKYEDADKTMRKLPAMPSAEISWFAAEPKTIAAAVRSPRRFRPSVVVLPGTMSVVPDGYEPVPPVALHPGLPVKYVWGLGWQDGWVLRSDGGQVEVQSAMGGSLREHKIEPTKIIATKADAKRVRSRASKRFYAEKLAEQQAAVEK